MKQITTSHQQQTFGQASAEFAKGAWNVISHPTTWGLGAVATLEIANNEIIGEAYADNPALQEQVQDGMMIGTPLSWLSSRLIGWGFRKAGASAKVARTAMLVGGPMVGFAGGRVGAHVINNGEISADAIQSVTVAEANIALPSEVAAAAAGMLGSKSASEQQRPHVPAQRTPA